MRTNSDIKKRAWSVFLLALFLSYTANTTLFVHIHIVNGRLISHSHFYRGIPDNPGHEHSSAQYQTIAFLSYLLMSGVSMMVFTCILIVKKNFRRCSIADFKKNTYHFAYGLRAPPLC
jgi:hypothetical protein